MKLQFWNGDQDDVENDIRQWTESLRRKKYGCGNRNGNGSRKQNDSNGVDDNDDDDDDDVDSIKMFFMEIIFDDCIALALKEAFELIAETRKDFYSSKIISRMQFDQCLGNSHLNEVINNALKYDVVEVLCVDARQGGYNLLSSDALSSPTSPINLRKLDLQNFEISAGDIERLRMGILNPDLRKAGGGLTGLTLIRASFQDDTAVEQFAETISRISQKPQEQQQKEQQKQQQKQQDKERGKYFGNLWLNQCNLEDNHLERIMKSLMTTTMEERIRGPRNDSSASISTTAIVTSPVAMESTLKSLTVNQKRCGTNFFALLGAWLLDSETSLLSRTILRPVCSLEHVYIYNGSFFEEATASATDPVTAMTQELPWWNEQDASTIRKTNKRLKSLILTGANDMIRLGRMLSELLLGLECFSLYSGGSSDKGIRQAEFENFVSGSMSLDTTPKNFVLRELTFDCREKPTRAELESCSQLEELLDRYPMLGNVQFGHFKRSAGSSVDAMQHKMNTNASGRFLFIPPTIRPFGLSVSLWPTVLEAFYRRRLAEANSRYDDRLMEWIEFGPEDEEENNGNGDGDGDAYVRMTPRPINNSHAYVMEEAASAIFSLLRLNMNTLIIHDDNEEHSDATKKRVQDCIRDAKSTTVHKPNKFARVGEKEDHFGNDS